MLAQRSVSLLRAACSQHTPLNKLSRCLYSSTPNINIEKDEKNGIAVLKLCRPPVNSLGQGILEDIVAGLDDMEKDPTCRGVIITSALPGVFCAGLELTEMYQASNDRLREYWTTVQEWWLRLYGSPLAVISCINGHSPGGGCMMALCSDYRIMSDGPFSIGLNEGALGIVAPTWSYFVQAMMNASGMRNTEKAIQLGALYSAEEALSMGIVDELRPHKDILRVAQETMATWLRIPDHARQMTKASMRKDTLKLLTSIREKDAEEFVNIVTQESVQRTLGNYIEKLKKMSG